MTIPAIPAWITRALESNYTRSLDSETDRLAVALALTEARDRCCRFCDADLTGKHDRTHFAKVGDQRPCKGSYP